MSLYLNRLVKILEDHNSPKLVKYVTAQIQGTAEYEIPETHIPHILWSLLKMASTTPPRMQPHIWEEILLGEHPSITHPLFGSLAETTPYKYIALSIINLILCQEDYMDIPRKVPPIDTLRAAIEREYPPIPQLPKRTSDQALSIVKNSASIHPAVWARVISDKIHEISKLENKTVSESYYPDGTLSKHVSHLPKDWIVFKTNTLDQYITHTLDCIVSASGLLYLCNKTNKTCRSTTRIYPSFKVTPEGAITTGWLTTVFEDEADITATIPAKMSFEGDRSLFYEFIESKYISLDSTEFV